MFLCCLFLFLWKWKSFSSVRFCDPVDCSPPGSSVHGILQTRTMEGVAIPFSRGSSRPRDCTRVSCIAGRFFTTWITREAIRETQIKEIFFFRFPKYLSILKTCLQRIWSFLYQIYFSYFFLNPYFVCIYLVSRLIFNLFTFKFSFRDSFSDTPTRFDKLLFISKWLVIYNCNNRYMIYLGFFFFFLVVNFWVFFVDFQIIKSSISWKTEELFYKIIINYHEIGIHYVIIILCYSNTVFLIYSEFINVILYF